MLCTSRYHPVGFAYIAGGAHTSCKSKDDGVGGYLDDECPELGAEDGGSTLSYHVDGEIAQVHHSSYAQYCTTQTYADAGKPVTNDASTFGLDAYEPLFFNSQDWWAKQKPFQVALTVPADAPYTKIYYFCHVHAHVSAEIEIYGSTATSTTTLAPEYLGGMTEESALKVPTHCSRTAFRECTRPVVPVSRRRSCWSLAVYLHSTASASNCSRFV